MAELIQQMSMFFLEPATVAAATLLALTAYVLTRLLPSRGGPAMVQRAAPAGRAPFDQTVQASGATKVASQIERLFGLLEAGAASTERAAAAHLAAARHLDSAEYQLMRLLDEFPILSTRHGQTRQAAPLSPARPAPSRALAA